MERKVLTEDEITKIKDLKKEFKDLTNAIGETEVQLMNLEFTKEQLKIGFQNIQQQEMVIAKELEEKYGEGTISLESGEFLPNE
jgi:TolA-binding protein|tara:strand:- start:3734 stop:3985 length:252 start_codon:yes stop_codon:yes gene_type:complete